MYLTTNFEVKHKQMHALALRTAQRPRASRAAAAITNACMQSVISSLRLPAPFWPTEGVPLHAIGWTLLARLCLACGSCVCWCGTGGRGISDLRRLLHRVLPAPSFPSPCPCPCRPCPQSFVPDVQRPVAAPGGALQGVAAPGGALQGRSFASVAPIKANSMVITRAATLKPKPTFDISLPFGTKFSDHMLEVDWDIKTGFGAPRIVPYHALAIDPSSPCLHYGVQCFEGMKAYKDEKGRVRLFRPDMNMKRFKTSCQRLSLPTFDESQMLECLKKLIQEDKDWVPQETGYSLYIRPTAIATSETLGVSPPHHALFYVITCPVGPYFKAGFAPVKILAEDSFRRAWPGGVGNYKVGGNYAPGLLPQKLAADKGYSQILWLFGEEQYITEVGSMNLFVFWENSAGKQELITAPLDGTILPGLHVSPCCSKLS